MSATGLLPLTYDECRARFRHAAASAGHHLDAYPIEARGPHGQELTIDVVVLGATRPRRALSILSGVHGVEGYLNSQLQVDLLGRLDPASLPDDVCVVLIHAVNPWGMAWWRRQNESNVDLNRNWRRSVVDPVHNDAYDVLHPIACPDTADLPSIDDLLVAAFALVEEHGVDWIRDGITVGQYRHPDGLHYGGTHTEASNTILETIIASHLTGVERSLVLDLHTGHGPRSAITLLSDDAEDAPQDQFLRRHFGGERVMATVGNPNADTAMKSGQIASGFSSLLDGAIHYATSVEFGTTPDEEQLAATYLERWVHVNGDRTTPEHAAVIWAYRSCFSPADVNWRGACLTAGSALLDDALAAVASWP